MRFLIVGVTYCALCGALSAALQDESSVSHLLRGPVALLNLGMLGSMLGGGTLVVCGMCFCGSALAPRRVAIALFVLGLIWWHLAGLGRILMDPWL